MSPSDIEHYSFGNKNTSGKKLLIIGGVHGNEPCGSEAIEDLLVDLRSNNLTIENGLVTFVPVANQRARAEQKRFCEEDLNRILKKTDTPTSHEAQLANILCELIDTHDVILDIHSSFTPCPSHAFVDYPTEENLGFAKSLNPSVLIYDWPKVYMNNPFSFPAWTTDRYAHEAGKVGLIVECGQHDAPQSVTVAKDIILRTLEHFGLIAVNEAHGDMLEPVSIYMDQIFKRDTESDEFAKTWCHLDSVRKGETIATRLSGESIVAPYDGHILFPKSFARAGEEWFYFAHKG